MSGRGALAVSALLIILLISAAWWALALWPAAGATPAWLARTREVCFGAAPGGLPDTAGWILLIGEPFGLLGILVAVWGSALRDGLVAATARWPGRILSAGIAAMLLFGIFASARVVAEMRGEPFAVRSSPTPDEVLISARVNDSAPELRLLDQHGATVDLHAFRGRPVIVTFGYGHCVTVCPVTVRAARLAVERETARNPILLVVTLDPWRDTPARLPVMAAGWELGTGMHLLGGAVDQVEATLTAWRIPRVRNIATGDLSHPAIVYVVSPAGRITYALGPDVDAIAAAVAVVAPRPPTP